jgi:hypothetical protein
MVQTGNHVSRTGSVTVRVHSRFEVEEMVAEGRSTSIGANKTTARAVVLFAFIYYR